MGMNGVSPRCHVGLQAELLSPERLQGVVREVRALVGVILQVRGQGGGVQTRLHAHAEPLARCGGARLPAWLVRGPGSMAVAPSRTNMGTWEQAWL
jgi:hypothetical protein